MSEERTMPVYCASWYTATKEGLFVLRMMYAPTKISITGSTNAKQRFVRSSTRMLWGC